MARNGYTVDLDGLEALASRVRPKLITIGGSLRLFPDNVREIRASDDTINAKVLFDAAHQCGMNTGRAWANPLTKGAHLVTISTYKSSGEPPSGLIVTNESAIAEWLDQIAFPRMTINFDTAKLAVLVISMLDWRELGVAYADK